MLTNTELKLYTSLLHKKYRESESKFIVEGEKLIPEAVGSGFNCEVIIVTTNYKNENPDIIKNYEKLKIRVEAVQSKTFVKLSDTKSPQGILGVFLMRKSKLDELINSGARMIVYLDNISDPGNVGTIIRNCDWFGIEDVLLSKNCVELYNPKVIRAAMGSVFHLNIFENINIKSLMPNLSIRGYRLISSDLEGENIYGYELLDKAVIVFSNEANGPSKEISELADEKIVIPGHGKAESLNVASASAVILSELVNQSFY